MSESNPSTPTRPSSRRSLFSTPKKTVYEIEQEANDIVLGKDEWQKCRVALAKMPKRVVAFYANPLRNNPRTILDLTGDMQTVVMYMSPFDYYLAHYTTRDIMTDSIIKYRPEIVCYFGHAEKDHLFLDPSAPRDIVDKMTAAEFVEILEKNTTTMRCVALFACSTAEIARLISSKPKFADTYVIFWHTAMLDSGARIFARAFLGDIAKFESASSRVEHAYHKGYTSFQGQYKIGDPNDNYLAWMEELTRSKLDKRPPDPSKRPAAGIPGIMLNGVEIAIEDIAQVRVARVEMPSLARAADLVRIRAHHGVERR